ncbi:MAG TPA: hypothetical protein VJY35_12665, partial [Candidatus Eisenbacteria bacterium]|nr:hypothetical protein [Candidatus Eisenbacteria bacterium]
MRTRWLLPAFGLVAAGLAHLAFSPLGFNPTDDGFVLAMSRRLLEGQVPHRDFISIRPVGSALLHAPEVWLGGTHTYWLSRLVVWLELALIAGSWVRIARNMRGRAWSAAESALMLTIAIALSSHTFPIMAWHTIDGLALGSLGLALASAGTPRRRIAGYLLVGSAVLCKQNFALLVPAGIVLFGDLRRAGAWLAAAAPAALYILFLAVTGALGDAVQQMSSQTDVLHTTLLPVLGHPFLYVGAAVGLVVVELGRTDGRLAVLGPIAAAVAVIAVAAVLGTPRFDAGAVMLL